ncbi:hypothetical protein R1flu_022977 [Riccia fluitans]|uniref:Uncharacterized protein n=1 Tax=Riccia fluitans TaxID=41844 RepID=A0ABD1XQQ2_9MARC
MASLLVGKYASIDYADRAGMNLMDLKTRVWSDGVLETILVVLQVFGVSTDPKPGVDGHVLPNPVDPNSYMFMLCYKNGSLTRREVRDRCAGKSWGSFNQYLDDTPPLNGEAMLSRHT